MNKTLENISVGQRVAILLPKGDRKLLTGIETVKRLTETQIITDQDHRYHRETGYAVGRGSFGVGSNYCLVPASEEHEKMYQDRKDQERQNREQYEATRKKLAELALKFPQKCFPSISNVDLERCELVFNLSLEDAERLAEILRSAF